MESQGRRPEFCEIRETRGREDRPGEKMLILISSGAQQRYADDILRALAHPAGTSFQFRYDDQYVAGGLRHRDVGGDVALICYLLIDATSKTVQLIPCRFTTVERVERVGSSWIFTLIAESFVDSLDDKEIRSSLNAEEKKLIPKFNSSGNKIDGKFAIDVTENLRSNSAYAPGPKAFEAFEKTAVALSADRRFATGNGLSFYTVCALKTTDHWWWECGNQASEITPVDGRYPLQLGWRYWLELYSYSPTGSTPPYHPTQLACESSDPAVRFTISPSHTLDSRYDLNRSEFTSLPAPMSVPAGLRISLKVPDQTKPSNVSDRCDITLEARFRGSLGWTIARLIFIAIGAAAPAAIAAAKIDKLTWQLFAIMVLVGAISALGTFFPTLKK